MMSSVFYLYGVRCYCFFFKQKTAYEMRISYWSSDVCSSDLVVGELHAVHRPDLDAQALQREDGGRVSDVAIGDVRLDGDHVHRRAGRGVQGRSGVGSLPQGGRGL